MRKERCILLIRQISINLVWLKDENSAVTDMTSYISDKNKLKVIVTHKNGNINFFECTNLNIIYEFNLEGTKDKEIYMP